jgi:DNA/RNA endonuclease G (NUC1)/PKD repeat protein
MSRDLSSTCYTKLDAITLVIVPRIGLPYTNTSNVEINPGQLPEAVINLPSEINTDNLRPVIQTLKVAFSPLTEEPLLYITAENLGADLSNLEVDFTGAQDSEPYSLEIVQDLSNLSAGLLVVRPTNQEFISSNSKIQIKRTIPLTGGPDIRKSSIVPIEIEVPSTNLALVPQSFGNTVSVFRTDNYSQVIADNKDNSNLLVAKIKVGEVDENFSSGGPRFTAITSDRRRAYTTLEVPGEISAIDLLTMRQIDAVHVGNSSPYGSATDATIHLPPGAKPFDIVIDAQDKYAYITDRSPHNGMGVVYVLDVDPTSKTFHQVVSHFDIAGTPSGLRRLAIDPNGKNLYVTNPHTSQGGGEIIAIAIKKDKKGVPKLSIAHRFEVGVEPSGVTVAPHLTDGTSQVVFTNRQMNGRGVGVITINNGAFSSGTINYISLGLGVYNDYFSVNAGVDVTISSDGKYAFVAGRNDRLFGAGIPSIDGDYRAGSNIGIIKDPLTSHAKLVAATRPIYGDLINGVALSADNKVLFGVGQLTGSVFAYNVDEIRGIIESPEKFKVYKTGTKAVADPQKLLDLVDLNVDPAQLYEGVNETASELLARIQALTKIGLSPYSDVPLDVQLQRLKDIRSKYIGVVKSGIEKTLDNLILNFLSRFIGNLLSTEVVASDFEKYPIDDLNPFIDAIAGDLRHLKPNNGLEVPLGSSTPPLGIGNNPYSVETTSIALTEVRSQTKYIIDRNILNLDGVPDEKVIIKQNVVNSLGNGVIYGEVVKSNLVATLPPIIETERLIGLPGLVVDSAKDLVLIGKDALIAGGEVIGVPAATLGFAVLGVVLAIVIAADIATSEINLTISTFPQGEGLGVTDEGFVQRPTQTPEKELYTKRDDDRDYNPNRVHTLKWKLTDQVNNLGQWYFDGKLLSPELLPGDEVALDALNLTAGQKYYWQGEAVGGLSGIRVRIEGGDFSIPQHHPKTDPDKTFSSVTVITPDAKTKWGDLTGKEKALEIAQGIARNFDGKGDNGTILVFDQTKNTWTAPIKDFNSLTNLTPNKFGAPLILIDDWGFASEQVSNGFAEASADNFFAALTSLNQSFTGSKKDALFNSPLHFIGHGRGAVVNSEVIQRLGTYFPHAGGIERDADGKVTKGDLQMTTIDAYDYQLYRSYDDSGYYLDPRVQVWDNVTFADSYYQTVSSERYRGGELVNRLPIDLLPNGSTIDSKADLSIELSGLQKRSGFTQEDLQAGKDPHNNALAWYAGTADLSLIGEDSAFGTPILRRKGDFSQDVFYDGSTYVPWYTNEFQQVSGTSTQLQRVVLGAGDAQWEGVGTGWYYSIIGGGDYRRRKESTLANPRTPIFLDNTATKEQRGDFAVPTLFDGNFDAVGLRKATDPIPGWVFEGLPNTGQDRLKLWSATLPIDSPDLDVYPNNYALELRSGESLVHNSFVVPDWGALRFDLHVQNPQGGTLQVLIKGDNPNDIWQPLETIVGENNGSIITSNAITLVEGDYSSPNPLLHDPNQLAYALDGFETFQFNIPESLRSKTASIKFTVQGNTTVYLDNIFFKSKHLILGNPTLTDAQDGVVNQEARFNSITHPNNYLVERPQYSLSYNNREKGSNWVSYELNKSWVGNLPTGDKNWSPDYVLLPLVGTQDDWYSNTNAQIHKGHMVTRSHRNRNNKDQTATYFTSSMLPQHKDNNSEVFQSAWYNFEKDLRQLVVEQNKEIYIISGGIGSAGNNLDYFIDNPPLSSSHPFKQNQINYPEETWKVAVILNPGETIADITRNTVVVSIITPNEKTPPNLTPDELIEWRNWRNWRVSVDDIEAETGLDLLSNIPKMIQDDIERHSDRDITGLSAPLFADFTRLESNLIKPNGAFDQFSVGHSGLVKEASLTWPIELDSTFKTSVNQNRFIHLNRKHVSSLENDVRQNGLIEVGMTQISTNALSPAQLSFPQICVTQVSVSQINSQHFNPTEVCMTEIDASQIITQKQRSTEIDSLKIDVGEQQATKIKINEITFPISISSKEFSALNELSLNSHSVDSQLIDIYSIAQTRWHTTTPIDIIFKITNLSTGQLAEGTITGYNTNGRPNSAIISIDDDANGVGWFMDTTPEENSEFSTRLTNTAYQATTGAAVGKYDLLTAILHETGHILGFINGYSEFDRNIKNGKFITDTITAQLTPDGSHLDSTLYPYDLLNTSLKPGIRKLPSQLDLAIINQLYSHPTNQNPTPQNPNAALTAGALYAIENGDFTNTTGWNLQGGTTISNGAATLSEASQKLAQLTQDLIIPAGAKRLQFTIKDNHLVLGDSSKTASDAFEVALLNSSTFKPLAGTSQGLSNTDSLLNIQANGTTYKSNKVTITPLTATSEIVSIDISDITPETKATLYFNLLGFGARSSTVTIDDIKIFSADQPIANNDNIVTNQSTPVTIDPTTNDSNVVGIQIIDRPTHGNLSQNSNGQIVYQPDTTYLGTDRFTYIGYNSEGSISNQGTVSITINNVPPVIENITIPTSIKEGQPIQLTATAKDNGSSDNLTYSWNLGDGTIVKGQQISHTFADNGIYQAILTVTDKDGGATEKAIELKVDNAAPNIVSIDRPTQINEGQPTQFKATATDSGINDTLTYSWNFGDGSIPVTGQNVSHIFVDNGNYNVALTVTDNDGAATTKTELVKVDNVLPSIVSINKPTQINEGQNVEFSAIATDAGSIDTLTYNWNFGDGSAPATGQTINHTFIDNGIYNAVLTVTDKDGGVTTQAVAVKVDNVAPVVTAIVKPAQINEGQAVEFKGTATDAGTNDTLTYVWNFGDTTNPVIGQNVTHTFVDNGNYNVVLTVTDKDGAATTQTTAVKVDNVAPVIVSIVKPAQINEGQAVEFKAIATDVGINDTLTYSWNFADGSTPVNGQTISHTFVDNRIYNAILTVTDKDGGATQQAIEIKVDNA